MGSCDHVPNCPSIGQRTHRPHNRFTLRQCGRNNPISGTGNNSFRPSRSSSRESTGSRVLTVFARTWLGIQPHNLPPLQPLGSDSHQQTSGCNSGEALWPLHFEETLSTDVAGQEAVTTFSTGAPRASRCLCSCCRGNRRVHGRVARRFSGFCRRSRRSLPSHPTRRHDGQITG